MYETLGNSSGYNNNLLVGGRNQANKFMAVELLAKSETARVCLGKHYAYNSEAVNQIRFS